MRKLFLPQPSRLEILMKRIQAIDIAKFVMAIMVVCIHIHPFGGAHELLMPLYRCAVPIFAMISTYLAFSKLNSERERQ